MLKTLTIVTCLMGLATLALWLIGINTSEFGPIEMMQNVILCIALIAWVSLTLTIRQQHKPTNFHFIFAYFFSALVYVVLGRELSWLKVLTGNTELAKGIELGSIILVLGLLLSMLYLWVVKIENRWVVFTNFIKSNTFKFTLAGLFFVLVGDVFEKKLLPVTNPQLFEEMAELTGYVFVLVAAFTELKAIRKTV